jgi:hypothetical protein
LRFDALFAPLSDKLSCQQHTGEVRLVSQGFSGVPFNKRHTDGVVLGAECLKGTIHPFSVSSVATAFVLLSPEPKLAVVGNEK